MKTLHTERNAQWYRRFYRKLAMRWIDVTCCNGRLSAEYTRHLGLPAERIKIGNMVPDADGLRKRLAAIDGERTAQVAAQHQLKGPVFLYVGRLIRLKGLREMLAGWNRFVACGYGREATLLLVGEGPEQGWLQQYCRDHALTSVRFAGAIDYDDIAVYYRCADAFIIPTLEDNWSLVVPEAMACGLPILCSKYNGCWPELVTRANGWVFDPLSTEDVCRTLMQAWSSKNQWVQMGEHSKTIVSTYTAAWAAQSIHEACQLACRLRRGAEMPSAAPAPAAPSGSQTHISGVT